MHLQDTKNSFDFIESCRKIIAYDSTPQASTLEVVHYLEQLSKALGFEAEVQSEMQNGVLQANIIVRLTKFLPNQSEFLMQTHLDTADAGQFPLWKKNNFNPFDAVIENQRIYGLGAAEVKLDFLCKLKALLEFKNSHGHHTSMTTKLAPVLVGTFGEETGMHGALKLIRKNKINAKFALIGEPSNLNIINAAKGFATVEMHIPFGETELQLRTNKEISESTTTQTKIFSGLTAHSSTPHLGESAALKVFEYLSKMPSNVVIVEIDAGTRFNMIPHQAMVEHDIVNSFSNPMIVKLNKIYEKIKAVQASMALIQDTRFEPQHSTLSVGIIRTQDNKILIGGSCRILPSVKQENYEHWMKMISDVCIEVGGEFKLQDYKKPFYTSENSVLLKGALAEFEKLGVQSKCISMASTNEASLFSRIGVECICVGAGERENNLHTPTENVKIQDLEIMSQFYKNMIERFCL